MEQPLLPLFPLQVVLFPRTPLPLHIFEDRYKEMIGEAMKNKSEFGVVLANEKGIVNTGCTATVEKVVQQYADGRMDIVTVGRRRFEIQALNDERTFLRGAVEFFDDEQPDPASTEVRQRVLENFEIFKEVEQPETLQDPQPDDPQLSFQLAHAVPDLEFRQVLLSTRSEAERMQRLAEFFPVYNARQRQVAHVKRVAPTNGHGRWPQNL
jgi:Lon protease-like protein